MKNAVIWFELPATDLSRAKEFYESVLSIEMRNHVHNDLEMALFPWEDEGVGGAICYHPDFYKTGHEGAVVYLNVQIPLARALSQVEGAGGKILQDKKLVSESIGYMALIEDSEGNRVGLLSKD